MNKTFARLCQTKKLTQQCCSERNWPDSGEKALLNAQPAPLLVNMEDHGKRGRMLTDFCFQNRNQPLHVGLKKGLPGEKISCRSKAKGGRQSQSALRAESRLRGDAAFHEKF